MKTDKDIFDKWLYTNPMDDGSVAVFRIIFSFFCLVSVVGVLRVETLVQYPSSFFSPQIFVAYLFGKLPDVYTLNVISVLNVVFLVAMLLGFKTRWSSILFGLTYIVSTSFIYAFSKIGHQHFIPYTAIIFAFSGWGQKFSIDSFLQNPHKKAKSYNIYPFFTLIVAFSFFTSGGAKILGGWLDPHFQAVRFYLLRDVTFVGRHNILTDFAVHGITSKFFWEFMDYFIVVIETLPLFVLFYPKIFRFLFFLLASFHVGVYLTMNITFGMYPIIYLPFIVNWENSFLVRWLARTFEILMVDKKRMFVAGILLAIVSLYLHFRFNFNGPLGLSLQRGVTLILSYIVVLYFFVEQGLIFFREKLTPKDCKF